MVPPTVAASRASATAGNAASSRGSKVQVAAADQSSRGAASATRSGQARLSEIGSRMSGGEAWMIVAPSADSTIEGTIDWGGTTTSIRSSSKPNSRCASITSRPLFTNVAELTVTSGPIFQVGWASACSGVTLARASRRRPRNGPPPALRAPPGPQALGDGGVLGVDRHDLPGLGPAGDQRAADDQRFLVGQGQ